MNNKLFEEVFDDANPGVEVQNGIALDNNPEADRQYDELARILHLNPRNQAVAESTKARGRNSLKESNGGYLIKMNSDNGMTINHQILDNLGNAAGQAFFILCDNEDPEDPNWNEGYFICKDIFDAKFDEGDCKHFEGDLGTGLDRMISVLRRQGKHFIVHDAITGKEIA